MNVSFIYELSDPDGNKMIGYCKEGRDPRPDLEKKRGLTGLNMDVLGKFEVDEDPNFVGKIMPRIMWYYYQIGEDDYDLNINTPGESYARKDIKIYGEDKILEVYKDLVEKYEV